MMMHRVGYTLVNTIDNVVISVFVGVAVLGKYSNYALLASTISGIIYLFFTPLVSVVGHLCAQGDKEKIKQHFEQFYFLNYSLGVVSFLGYYAISNQIVSLCFGNDLEVSRTITFIIALNSFVQFMSKTTRLFRNASGTYYYDRWKPLVEGIVNLVLSVLFVQFFPEEYRVVGVLAATIITNLFICHIVEPFVIYRYVFEQSIKEYYLRYYSYIILFVAALFLLTYFTTDQLLLNGIISIGISAVLLGVVVVIDRSLKCFSIR